MKAKRAIRKQKSSKAQLESKKLGSVASLTVRLNHNETLVRVF